MFASAIRILVAYLILPPPLNENPQDWYLAHPHFKMELVIKNIFQR